MFCTNEEFVPPPECPVFEPTWDEFKDTMSYIEKIRAIAEKSGICKIRPPPEWRPPFVIDMDSFRFTPRIQKLNELEAQSRVKIIFLNGLSKFWELQGTQLKIPMVDRKYLDLCKLQKVVREEGGFVLVCNERKWARIANRLNYPPGKGISSTLRSHYERILYPYDLFQAGVTVDCAQKVQGVKDEVDEDMKIIDLDYVPDEVEKKKVEPKVISPKLECSYETRRTSRMNKDGVRSNVSSLTSSSVTSNQNSPRRMISRVGSSKTGSVKEDEKKSSSATADQYFCEVCSRGDMESLLLLCDGCDDAYHTFCLLPPLNEVPVGDWRCPKCVAKECYKPIEAYGFEQAEREYTLESFGEMADKFKLNYFKMPAHLVPSETVEKEFWRLVSCLDEDVVVEYGADIHAAEHGSGFPTAKTPAVTDDQSKMYTESGWNLNNLPVLPSSVLQYISADISGMKVPWVYIGMCFSSFSWHTEDHWSYSVNYMHWGEPKTWYGVPGAKAELLEECMKKIAPELFEHSPDLMHQLTTILNPNVLMAYGVPITRTDQHAGEFVITFPRSYHGGFNQGFNCAEAVNFCPADWLPYGRASVQHYKELHRQCVFSNDELMCKMASAAETLDVSLARRVYEDLAPVFEEEKRLRKGFVDRGLTNMERESFELLQDDERQCDFCKTTCFVSSITCPCSPNRMVCLDHIDHLCRCKFHQRSLRYQLTVEELDILLSQLKDRSEAEDRWKRTVQGVVSHMDTGCHKPDLADLKNLIHEALRQKLPDNDELQLLTTVVQEAEKLQATISQITGSKIRTRQRGNGGSRYASRLKAEDLRCLCGSVDDLRCKIREADALKDLLKKIDAFQDKCRKVLDAVELPNTSVIQELLNEAEEFIDVDLEEFPKLNQVLAQAKWLEEVSLALEDRQALSLAELSALIDNGTNLVPHPSCEVAMAELQNLLTICQELEQRASVWIKSWKETGNKLDRDLVKELLKKAETVEAYLPGVESLKDFIGKADDWKAKAVSILNRTHLPHLDDIEMLVSKGAQIPLAMELHDMLNQKQNDARTWLLRINETLRSSHRPHSIIQQLLKRFLHQRNSLSPQESQSCCMLEEYLAVESGCRRELERIRRQNVEKSVVEPGTTVSCHVCKNEITKFRRKCPVCLDLCHAKCLLQKCSGRGHSNSVIACPSCCPSGHPKLDTIESLVASYRALGICLPVGEALSAVLSQSSKWRLTAAEALRSEDVSKALGTLDGTDSSSSTDDGCSMIDSRCGNVIDSRCGNMIDSRCGNVIDSRCGNMIDNRCENMMDSSDVDQSDECRDKMAAGLLVALATAEHTYSAPRLADSDAGCILKQTTKKPVRRRPYPVVNIPTQSRILLDELMVEGWIIDVDMVEMADISRLICSYQDGRTRKRKSVKKDGSQELQQKKRKVDSLVNVDRTSSSPLKTMSPGENGELVATGCTSVKGVGAKEPVAAAVAGKTVKRRERKQKMQRKQEQKEGSEEKSLNDDGSTDSEADSDEICSAGKCQRPKAKKVNWVQCDRCLLWFHLLCIGQTMNQISREKYYVCTKCVPRGSPPCTTVARTISSSDGSGSNPQPLIKPLADPVVDHQPGLIFGPPVLSRETVIRVQQSAPQERSPVLGILQQFSFV